MLAIRLARIGKKKRPFYRVVVLSISVSPVMAGPSRSSEPTTARRRIRRTSRWMPSASSTGLDAELSPATPFGVF